jgi:hypothetical protein
VLPASRLTPSTATLADRNGDDGPEPYSEVITPEAVTERGLFDVHRIGDDLFYEIPLDRMGEEFLFLSRVAQTPDGAGYGGHKSTRRSYGGSAGGTVCFSGW